jgi:hypothetical protein
VLGAGNAEGGFEGREREEDVVFETMKDMELAALCAPPAP